MHIPVSCFHRKEAGIPASFFHNYALLLLRIDQTAAIPANTMNTIIPHTVMEGIVTCWPGWPGPPWSTITPSTAVSSPSPPSVSVKVAVATVWPPMSAVPKVTPGRVYHCGLLKFGGVGPYFL
jgi:hypothetical protein